MFAGILAAENFSGDKLILKGSAREKDGVITLDGKSGYVSLKGTEDWNISPAGLSIACAVKIAPQAETPHKKNPFHMFFSKGKPAFIAAFYGRNGMYTNIWDKKTQKSAAPMLVNYKPEAGTWFHAAVTFEHYNDIGQGNVGYTSTLYINGNRIGRMKHQGLVPMPDNGLLEIGKGWGGPWMLAGQVGEIRAEKRVWREDEIAAFTDQSKLVKGAAVKRHNPALDKFSSASAVGRWYLAALHRLPAARGTQIAEKLQKSFAIKDNKKFISEVKKNCKELHLAATPEVLLLFDTRSGQGEPLLGMYDFISGKTILEDRLFSWSLLGNLNKKRCEISSGEQTYKTLSVKGNKITVRWQINTPARLDVTVNYTVENNGVAADLKVDNLTQNFLLTRVIFPETRTPRLGKDDALLYPFQCGALIKNPTKNNFKRGQNGRYPGNSMTMQFSAYYGDGRGVFTAWEDPDGTIKDFQATGKRNGMEFKWEQNAVIPLDKTSGGNSYRSPGRAVFRVFAGKWFEACMLHKKWAVSSPVWKMPTLPRKDTPKWFRDAPVTISLLTPREDLSKTAYSQLMYLRKYLDVPVVSSVYGWQDKQKGSWPVFLPQHYIEELFRNMKDGSCYPEPYIDPMLWDILDGPNRKSDWRWSTHGKKFAVKLANGDIPYEIYAGGVQYGVMCPNSSGWRKELEHMIFTVAKLAPAIYHDELMTVQGYCCFDKSHGHPLNDPAGWLTRGFRPIYENFRKKLPGMPFGSEEVSEPWLDLFDNGHVWRWTFDGQIPAFQAVYGGRIQYTSLTYDSHSHGSYDSNFVKMANQLVTGQKLGRLYPGELEKADAKRLFLKKMVHLRVAITDYFNSGCMIAPVEFAVPVPLKTTAWGTSLPQTEDVTLPKILSGAYRFNGTDIFIFVNSTNETLSCQPKIPANWLCAENSKTVAPFAGKITLGPYQSAIAVKGPRKEAERLQKMFRTIAAFDAGEDFEKIFAFKEHRLISAVPGKLMDAAATSGYYNCSKYDNGKYFGNFTKGSLISYGTVDFGSRKVSELLLTTGVTEHYAGGQIEILTGPHQNMTAETLAVFTVPPTGGWEDFKEFKVKLKRPVSGKTNLVLRFSKTGCCNFSGWRFL